MYHAFPTIPRYRNLRLAGHAINSITAVLVCLILIAFASLLAASGLLPQWVQNEAYSALVVVVTIILIMSHEEMSRNPVHPLAFVLYVAAINFGVRGFMLEANDIYIPYSGNPKDHISQVCILIAISLVLYAVGYYSAAGAWLNKAIPDFCFVQRPGSEKGTLIRASLLYLAGWASRLFMFSHHYFHSQVQLVSDTDRFKSVLDDVSSFALFAYLAFATVFVRKRRTWTLLPMLIGETIYGAMYGGSSMLAMPFILLALVWHIYRKPFTWTQTIVAVVLIITVVGPALTGWRDAYYREMEGDPTPSLEKVARATANAISQPESLTDRDRTLARFGALDHTLMVFDRVPDRYPFQHGDTFIPTVTTMLIPRALWPDKPEVSIGHELAIRFGDDQNKAERGTNISISNVGELYYNFGYLGLALCPLFGIAIRFGWERFKRHVAVEQFALIWLPFLMFGLASVDQAISGYIANCVRGPIPIFVFSMLLYGQFPRIWRRSSRTAATPVPTGGRLLAMTAQRA